MGIRNYGRRIRDEGAREIAWELVRSWALPYVLPLVTMVAGYLQGMPWAYILVAMAAVFAFVTHGLVRLSEWRIIKSPENKLEYVDPNIKAIFNRDDPQKVDGISLGFTINSRYHFPLEVNVESITSRFINRVPQDNQIRRTSYALTPQGSLVFNGPIIDVSDLDLRNGEYMGQVSFLLKYGAPGSLKYSFEKSIDVFFDFNEHGICQNHSWLDSAQESS